MPSFWCVFTCFIDLPKVDINVLFTGTSKWKSDYDKHLNHHQYNPDEDDYGGDLETLGNYYEPETEINNTKMGENIATNKYYYEVIEREKFVINCKVTSNPILNEIKWFKDDLPLEKFNLGK